MDVPDEFWSGEQKLLWQAAHVEEIYQSFPTIYLSMAADENSSQEFCLAVVPQVICTARLHGTCLCIVHIVTICLFHNNIIIQHTNV